MGTFIASMENSGGVSWPYFLILPFLPKSKCANFPDCMPKMRNHNVCLWNVYEK